MVASTQTLRAGSGWLVRMPADFPVRSNISWWHGQWNPVRQASSAEHDAPHSYLIQPTPVVNSMSDYRTGATCTLTAAHDAEPCSAASASAPGWRPRGAPRRRAARARTAAPRPGRPRRASAPAATRRAEQGTPRSPNATRPTHRRRAPGSRSSTSVSEVGCGPGVRRRGLRVTRRRGDPVEMGLPLDSLDEERPFEDATVRPNRSVRRIVVRSQVRSARGRSVPSWVGIVKAGSHALPPSTPTFR